MAYYITKPFSLNPSTTLYYVGEDNAKVARFSDDPSGKVTYSTESEANAKIANPDGKNGGFRGATVVSE